MHCSDKKRERTVGSVHEMNRGDTHLRKKLYNRQSQKVKTDGLEDEVRHSFVEPKADHVSVNSGLHYGKQNAGKCFEIEDFSYGYDYGFNTFRGGLTSNIAQQGEDELELGVLDGLLDEVDEVEDVDAAAGLASPLGDFLLDIQFYGKAPGLDFGPCVGSHSRKSNSESHSPGLSGSSIVGISDSSTVTVQEFDCKNEPLDKTATDDLPGACRPKKRRHASIRGNICSTSHNLHGLDKFDDDENPVGCGILLDKKEESFVEASEVSREKRLRKPTLRFIEEFSDKKSKYFKAKETVSVITTTKGNRVKVRSHGKLDHMKPGALSSVAEEEFCGTEIQAVSEFRSLRGRPKKHVSTLHLEPDAELFASESEDDCMTGKRASKHDRRKHQRMWTLSEVVKLVDGISEFGVGRWTDIKRLLFASSAYRTPIDLRDKWRNLLRASSALKMKRREMEEAQSHSRPLPKSLLHRVRELSKIHPYPRQRGKKSIGQVAQLAPSSKGAAFGIGKKNVQRKNCT